MRLSPSVFPFHLRLAGVFYLAIIVLGLFGETLVRNTLIAVGDPSTTLANIQAAPGLWRAGIGGDLLMHVLDVPVIVVLYLLLKPVNAPLALLATLFNIVQTAVLAANKLTLLLPALIATQPAGPDTPGLVVLAQLAIQLHGYGFGIGLIFFGMACLVRAYLIVQSGYFPKAIGLLLGLAGLCYLINSAALLLAPALAAMLFPAIMMPPLVGELALCLWMMVRGVDAQAWQRRQTA